MNKIANEKRVYYTIDIKGEKKVEKNELIKKYRKEAGFTQEEVAKQLFISRHAYCQYETGARKMESDMFFRICEVLGVKWNHYKPKKTPRMVLKEYIEHQLQEKIDKCHIQDEHIEKVIDELDRFRRATGLNIKKELKHTTCYLWNHPYHECKFEFCIEIKNYNLIWAFTEEGEWISVEDWITKRVPKTKEEQEYAIARDRVEKYFEDEFLPVLVDRKLTYSNTNGMLKHYIYPTFPEYRPKEERIDLEKMEQEARNLIQEMAEDRKNKMIQKVICFTDEAEGIRRLLSYEGSIISKGIITNTDEKIYFLFHMKPMNFKSFCEKEKKIIVTMREKPDETIDQLLRKATGYTYLPQLYKETEIF